MNENLEEKELTAEELEGITGGWYWKPNTFFKVTCKSGEEEFFRKLENAKKTLLYYTKQGKDCKIHSKRG